MTDATLVDPAAAELPAQDELAEEPSEIERIWAPGTIITLESEENAGYELVLQKMMTRQFFRMLAILTSTVGPALVREVLSFQGGMKPDQAREFSTRLMGLLMMAIPEAEEKALAFVGSMVLPKGYIDKKPSELSASQRDENDRLIREMNDKLWNPPPEDTLVLVEAIVRSEARDLVALGNRAARMFATAIKSGQLDSAQSNGSAGPA